MSTANVFTKWIIIRSGFLQSKGNVGNGCVNILRSLELEYGSKGTRIELENWDDDTEHTAEYIYQLSSKENPPDVAIFAFSWGCGYGFINLARSLQKRGIDVKYAVLCDPVYYGLAKWRALIPKTLYSKVYITVPGNVKEVFWLRQNVSKPAGHDLRAESPYTCIHEPIILDVKHTDADNSPQFMALCNEVAAKLMAGPRVI